MLDDKAGMNDRSAFNYQLTLTEKWGIQLH